MVARGKARSGARHIPREPVLVGKKACRFLTIADATTVEQRVLHQAQPPLHPRHYTSTWNSGKASSTGGKSSLLPDALAHSARATDSAAEAAVALAAQRRSCWRDSLQRPAGLRSVCAASAACSSSCSD